MKDWSTFYEQSGYTRTPAYAETMKYCRRLEAASPWVHVTSFGQSLQGRELPLVILSKEKAFTPRAAARTKKAIVLIQSGIHAGEIDGKDASLMLMRDIAITKTKARLLDSAIVLFAPIFNVDGHERISKYNRINQDGPEEMGWRVTANNLNLNRDYMKAETPEMRAMLKLFSAWLPDFYFDCHVTDGIDFQYSVTFAIEIFQNIDPELASWLRTSFIPVMKSDVERTGNLVAPYMGEREENDLSKGFMFGTAGPRFSTGYGAVQNRPALLIETHVYKPYKTRVSATYAMLNSVLGTVNRNAYSLRMLNVRADARTASIAANGEYVPLRYATIERSTSIEFKGWKTTRTISPVTGQLMTYYSRDTVSVMLPYFDQVTVTDSVSVPKYYFIPQEWTAVIDVLRAHGVSLKRLKTQTVLNIDSYRLTSPVWQDKPYEGRHVLRCASTPVHEERTFPAGTYIVPTSQRTARVIANLLEPSGPDSFVYWGMFDTIFERKEYYEDGVMERIAKQMMDADPSLRREFEAKVNSDTTFAASARARLNFFYERSPYWENSVGLYPVARYNGNL
ncbi:MAG TPA: M14 family metallopeptidase [Bacteroidota bacterium]|nr:M14 family metallopeptidase [Bacteroidota bacterium]